MNVVILLLCILLSSGLSWAQSSSTGDTLHFSQLTDEALERNPDIRAAVYQMSVAGARVSQVSALDHPEFTYMREEMPQFRWSGAMMERVGLMQGIRFPTKLSKAGDIAEIRAEHAHHDHLEKVNEVLGELKKNFTDLWYAQQSIRFNEENADLLLQFATIAQTKYSVGQASQSDALTAQIAMAEVHNELIVLREQERGAAARINATLNRPLYQPLGIAFLSESVGFSISLEKLERLALETRPMITHDSLTIVEKRDMVSLANAEYIPDMKVGLEYKRFPQSGFAGWGIVAGISLPFAPWTIGKTNAAVEEAEAGLKRAEASYIGSKNRILSTVRSLYYELQAEQDRLRSYRSEIVPQAMQALKATTAEYRTGKNSFLTVIDSYRTLVAAYMSSISSRMRFEQKMADLEVAVGLQDLDSFRK